MVTVEEVSTMFRTPEVRGRRVGLGTGMHLGLKSISTDSWIWVWKLPLCALISLSAIAAFLELLKLLNVVKRRAHLAQGLEYGYHFINSSL